MENNRIYSYDKYQMSYQDYADTLREYILDKVDLLDGILQPFSLSEDHNYNIPLIDIRWKGNIHLVFYMSPHYKYYVVVRNGECVSPTWRVSVTDENTVKNFQKTISEINTHKYDNKKSYSDRVREIVSDRGLTSCMNKTKWSELSNILSEELDVRINIMYKTLFDDADPHYFWDIKSDEDWYPPLFKSIEWLKIDTVYKEYHSRGLLLDTEVISYDYTEKILSLLIENNIPYEETEEANVYIIYGYK